MIEAKEQTAVIEAKEQIAVIEAKAVFNWQC